MLGKSLKSNFQLKVKNFSLVWSGVFSEKVGFFWMYGIFFSHVNTVVVVTHPAFTNTSSPPYQRVYCYYWQYFVPLLILMIFFVAIFYLLALSSRVWHQATARCVLSTPPIDTTAWQHDVKLPQTLFQLGSNLSAPDEFVQLRWNYPAAEETRPL